MDRGPALSGKLAFSVFCALCACAIAVASPRFGRFTLQSGGFQAGQALPAQFTCTGGGALPPLQIADPPSGTASLAVLVDEPDAPGGTVSHLLAWNLPATTEAIGGELPAGATLGANGFGRVGWSAPCPPPGEPHRYRFQVLALKAPIALPPGADRAAFDHATRDQTLATATLTATFQR